MIILVDFDKLNLEMKLAKERKIKERIDVFLRRLIAERLIVVPVLDVSKRVMFEVLKAYIK